MYLHSNLTQDSNFQGDFHAFNYHPQHTRLRNLDFVFSTAMRRTGRSDLAEETAQAVFLLLARKAATFNQQVILPSWLYRATCLIAAASLRSERARQQKEREAGMMMSLESEEPLWAKLVPDLDQAMLQLSEKDPQRWGLMF